MTKKQKSVAKIKYGIVREITEEQFYIMQPDPKRKGWAVEVAYYLNGPKDDPKSWRLAKDDGSKYMTFWSDVDTKFSGFLEKLVKDIKLNEKNKTGAGK